MLRPGPELINELRASLSSSAKENLVLAVKKIAEAKSNGGAVVVVTGSGPNLHEGVTTLIADLITKGLVDGVITSSAIVAHEMAGSLDRVKRIRIDSDSGLDFPRSLLPRGLSFEITCLSASLRQSLQEEVTEGWDLYDRLSQMPGDTVIKAAGNMAWPMGPRTERLACDAGKVARESRTTVEHIVGLGADPRTMIGAAARRNVPIIVSVPQLVGGGAVGLAIGDATTTTQRSRFVADLLARAQVIIESAIALSQEIHDGPFETYTGHGIWAAWNHLPTFSLEGKTVIRIDLDPNLELAWKQERQTSLVQKAVDEGLPKTKLTGIPFRMEMSGFARIGGSLPVTADIGVAWPVMASSLEELLGVQLDFVSAPQETEAGRRMRNWIADTVQPVDRRKMEEGIKRLLKPTKEEVGSPFLDAPTST